jgi:hypothetical protein
MTRQITRKSIAALAATLVAASTFSTLAEANSVRLNFGGPLGSFVARPAGGGSYAGASYGASKHCAPKVQSVQRQSAPKPKRQIAQAERRVIQDEPKVERNRRAAAKPSVQVAAVEREVKTVTTEASEVPLTGSKALAVQDAEPAATETAAEASADASTEPSTGKPADETTAEEATRTAEARDVGCKKFIPAIGVTVTVGCNQ